MSATEPHAEVDVRVLAAAPYTARHCDACDTWVYCADGPFAEGDRTKTVADYDHWAANHATPAELAGSVIGFPYMSWNERPVTAVRNP